MASILITGANGQLGNELKTVSKKYYGYDFIFTDIDTLDICDKEKTAGYIYRINPDWIINCAAYNLVDKAESEPEKAMQVNATAVDNIVESVKGSDCRLIHFSSDYVFDGKSNIPYMTDSQAQPAGVYGVSKLAGEKAALSHHAALVIRTCWLYSNFGSNFVKTILAHAKEKGSLKVVYDQVGTPTYASDLAGVIMTIISGVIRNQHAFIPGIYHYSNEGVCSRYDFALAIVEEAEVRCEVTPIRTSEFKSAAQRPFYSVLDKAKIKENYGIKIPYWRDSLKTCIQLMK